MSYCVKGVVELGASLAVGDLLRVLRQLGEPRSINWRIVGDSVSERGCRWEFASGADVATVDLRRIGRALKQLGAQGAEVSSTLRPDNWTQRLSSQSGEWVVEVTDPRGNVAYTETL